MITKRWHVLGQLCVCRRPQAPYLNSSLKKHPEWGSCIKLNFERYFCQLALKQGINVISKLFHIFGYARISGSIQVSRNLPTYPSPKPTLTLTSRLGQNVSLGEGQVGSLPKLAWVSVVRTKATLTRHRTNFLPVENSCVPVLCSNGITLTVRKFIRLAVQRSV